jgi:uncharacterized protein YbbC (DUF1343 family)
LLVGLDILIKNNFDILKNKKIALLAHAASVDSNYNHILDILLLNNINIKVAFGPEHGLKSTAQDMEGLIESNSSNKYKTITLYDGTYESLFPKKEDLLNIDTILIDLQDIGSRYYTYVYTASFFLDIAKELNIEVIVLDRPNPIGREIEGNIVENGFESFVGYYPYFLNRHGLTIAEMLNIINQKIEANLKIIKVENYTGKSYFEEPFKWVLPSPNMPTPETAFLYPGGCLIEGTNLSEGRGTTKPFHFIGAPYINGSKLKQLLDTHKLDGIKFRDISFKPMFQKFANTNCDGVEIHIEDYSKIKPLKIYLTLIYEIYHNFKGFNWRSEEYEFITKPIAIDLLFGTDKVRKMIENGDDLGQIYNFITKNEEKYKNDIKKYYLY